MFQKSLLSKTTLKVKCTIWVLNCWEYMYNDLSVALGFGKRVSLAPSTKILIRLDKPKNDLLFIK